MKWEAESPVKLTIGVQLDASGTIIEDDTKEIAKTQNQIFDGFPASLTAADAKEAYNALTATFGYNGKDTDTVVMQINQKEIFKSE